MKKKPNNKLNLYLALHNMTKADLARVSGIHVNTIRDYVSERHMPSVIVAMRIAEILQCSVYDIWSTSDGEAIREMPVLRNVDQTLPRFPQDPSSIQEPESIPAVSVWTSLLPDEPDDQEGENNL
ncbi:MAG: helix-turn-helix transcriptional regulator [Clostridia bacterium]|nr:helix-turn-helix transcriptional regulator [Clostridia bacterium]